MVLDLEPEDPDEHDRWDGVPETHSATRVRETGEEVLDASYQPDVQTAI